MPAHKLKERGLVSFGSRFQDTIHRGEGVKVAWYIQQESWESWCSDHFLPFCAVQDSILGNAATSRVSLPISSNLIKVITQGNANHPQARQSPTGTPITHRHTNLPQTSQLPTGMSITDRHANLPQARQSTIGTPITYRHINHPKARQSPTGMPDPTSLIILDPMEHHHHRN